MKYYKSKGRNMGLSVGGCCSDPIFQQQLSLKSTPKSKISNTSSIDGGNLQVLRLSEKNAKYIEELKKILGIVKQ